jgi:S-adenosylmethionine:tRNA ribosyltransferase-isomerase
MLVSDFDFELPEDLIALRPASPRDSARLLVVRGPDGHLEDHTVRDLPNLLKRDDILVINDTRVLKAALSGIRPARGEDGADVPIEVNLNSQRTDAQWSAFARPGKRLRAGDVVRFGHGLEGKVVSKGEDGEILLDFNHSGPALLAGFESAGVAPLPPYIASKRAPDQQDSSDYQTIFADEPGSVAAPTAGLHFTRDLLLELERSGIEQARVTLHVNAGTFLPVKTDKVEDHRMHAERATVSNATVQRIVEHRAKGGRCIPVGTTALRTLETASAENGLQVFSGETSIFITPGYKFRIADGLMTNFHLPKSTLFMLVSAMMGLDVMKRAYAHAVKERYRFFSYGDACLLLPNG